MAVEKMHDTRTVKVFDNEGSPLESFDVGLHGIRSIRGMLQGLWSLADFSKGLSGRNGFSDVDGHAEIDGRGLVLEFKQSFNALNRGQVMKAIRQAKYQKTCTYFIEGETDNPRRMFAVLETGEEGKLYVSEVEEVTIDEVQAKIKQWEKWARANSLVKGNKKEDWNDTLQVMAKARISS